MALQMRLELDTGIVLPEAYVRITSGMLSLDRGMAFIVVQTYADREARMTGKEAVVYKEYRCTMDGAQPQIDAIYKLDLNNIEPESASELIVKLGEHEIKIREGDNFTVNGEKEHLVNLVADRLNKDYAFSTLFKVEVDDNQIITISAIEDGLARGERGNNLTIEGDMVNEFDLAQKGQDLVVPDFYKYFHIDVMDREGVNAISQAYEFIKSHPDFEGAIDVD